MKHYILIFTIFFIGIFGKPTGKDSSERPARLSTCKNQEDCNNGKCVPKEEVVNGKVETINKCECDKRLLSVSYTDDQDGTPCVVEVKNKVVAFLLSLFVGWLGADWFYLSKGATSYIVAGVFKIITCGGLGIWWIADIVRILCDSFPDSDGIYPEW